MTRKGIIIYVCTSIAVLGVVVAIIIASRSPEDLRQGNGGLDTQGSKQDGEGTGPPLRDLSAVLSRLDEMATEIRVPGNPESEEHVRSIVKGARLAWAECQDLANSGEVKIAFWNGRYSALYEPPGEPFAFSFTFESEQGEIVQCKKWAVFPGDRPVGRREYELLFYENGNVEYYVFGDGEQQAHFYPSGALQRIYFKTPDGRSHVVTWSHDGTFENYRVANTD